jgi:hypothetical protein
VTSNRKRDDPSVRAHALRTWTCPCGTTVRGNGGKTSHQRACRTWTQHLIERSERTVAQIDAGTYSTRMSPEWLADLRTRAVEAVTQLTARLERDA